MMSNVGLVTLLLVSTAVVMVSGFGSTPPDDSYRGHDSYSGHDDRPSYKSDYGRYSNWDSVIASSSTTHTVQWCMTLLMSVMIAVVMRT